MTRVDGEALAAALADPAHDWRIAATRAPARQRLDARSSSTSWATSCTTAWPSAAAPVLGRVARAGATSSPCS